LVGSLRVRLALSMLVLASLASPFRAGATSISVTGAAGADGLAGAAGNPGQAGSPGSPGEDATANATSTDPSNDATATGGAGGSGGLGGLGVPAGASSGNGGAGGAGGGATASSSSSTASDDANALSLAYGGAGGPGGIGGGAGDSTAGAAGAGGAGGAASSQASAVSSASPANAYAEADAIGGKGGGSQGAGGVGGIATASAYARADSGDAAARAFQQGGDGGVGGVTAGRGQDSVLVDAASGDAPGVLELDQYAQGGAGGEGPGSRGGDARSELSAERSSGTGLTLSVATLGGTASSPDGSPADAARGGNATAIADAVDHVGALVQVFGSAEAGSAFGPNSQVGQASLSVHGASTAGGDVIAQGYMAGGSGTAGGSVELVDAVSGETTGSLTLGQYVQGGSGTELAGSASSRLHRTGSFSALDVAANAVGGSATEGVSQADGGNAVAESMAANDAGGAHAGAGADGGNGASGVGSDGGTGESHSAAATSGDGHAAVADSYARGGWTFSDGALPGTAHSVSIATALGNSTVTATSTASGGVGNPGSNVFSGGGALAEATGSGAGSAAVVAQASATAGSSSAGVPSTQLGAAQAQALTSGLGFVSSTATTIGNASSSAQSEARSAGAVLASRAALAPLGPQSSVVGLGTDASFRAPSTQAGFDSLGLQGFFTRAVVNAAPSAGDAASWVAGSSRVEDAVSHASQLHALGGLRAESGVSGSLSLDFDGAALSADNLLIGFVNPHVPFVGFDVLDVQISFAGSVVWDLSFATPGEAQAALGDALFAIDSADIPSGVATLVVSWLFDGATSDLTFRSDVVVFSGSSSPVPEPKAMVLLVAALVALIRARGARAAR
jgi:hypothetical protein